METASNPDMASPSPLQLQVMQNMDFLLPQREWSPSRRAVKGAFTVLFCKTVEGLFSLFISRLVTYNTNALRQMPVAERIAAFQDLESWEMYISVVKTHFPNEVPNFYCNRNAFGRQTHITRVLENAPVYWKAAKSSDWSSFTRATPVPFNACIKLLHKLRLLPTMVLEGGSNRVPLLGPLAQYLISTDLVYAGVVSMPSVEEIAQRIFSLKAGGLNGLKMLGYCPKSSSARQVIAGFKQFYEDTGSRLSIQEKEEMGWDVIMAEHTLCKITRLKKHWIVA